MEHIEKTTKKRFKHPRKVLLLSVLVFLGLALVGARLYLPVWLTAYVNKTLQNIPGYTGSVRNVDVALLRGAYVIDDLKLLKKAKDIPVPFLDVKRTDLSLQWGALFKGEVVGDVTLYAPIINFAVGKSGKTSQTGLNTDWSKPIRELMPLDINWLEINNGKVTYQDFSTHPKVDLFITDLYLKSTNIRNVDDKKVALPSTLTARGKSIGNGDLRIDGNLNILKKIPDMDLKGKLESVDLPALNTYAKAYAGIDFNKGRFDLYSNLKVKDGKVSGFAKPIATNVDLIDWKKPMTNPFSALWESIVSIGFELFENQSKDQFATQIVLEGTIDNPQTDFWSTLSGILHNAFVKAYSNTVKRE